MEESYFVYAQRLDLPSEVMCSTICGEHNLDSTKKFIRQRIAQENKKFAKGINPKNRECGKLEFSTLSTGFQQQVAQRNSSK